MGILNKKSDKKAGCETDDAIEKCLRESDILKQKLTINEKEISKKDKEISILTEEIMRLKQQLNNAVKNKKNDNVIYDILSDVDVKIKGMEKQILVNVKN